MSSGERPKTDYNPAIFRLERQRRGWSQARCASQIGRSQVWWSRLEKGEAALTAADYRAIRKLFRLSERAVFETPALAGE